MQTNPTVYNGVLQSCYSIFREEGVTAFWKGAVPTALGMAAENAMAFDKMIRREKDGLSKVPYYCTVVQHFTTI